MSIVLALKTEDNIYFMSESRISNPRSTRSYPMQSITARKIQYFKNDKSNIIVGLVGQAKFMMAVPDLAYMIDGEIANMLNGAEDVHFSTLDIYSVIVRWKKFLIENKILKAAISAKRDEEEEFDGALLIGIKVGEKHQLFNYNGFSVSECVEFDAIGCCMEAAKIGYELIDKQQCAPIIWMKEIISICAKYYPSIDDNTYFININHMEMNEL